MYEDKAAHAVIDTYLRYHTMLGAPKEMLDKIRVIAKDIETLQKKK
jgi:hypothetical protein